MKVLPLRLLFSLLWVSFYGCAGTSTRRDDNDERVVRSPTSFPFELTVVDHDGAMGYALSYCVAPERLTVTFVGDLENEPPRLIHQQNLSQSDLTTWQEVFHQLDVENLRPAYEDPEVADGLQLRFDIRLPGRSPKTIRVANTYQPDVARLVALLDRQLPPRYRINYRSPDEIRSAFRRHPSYARQLQRPLELSSFLRCTCSWIIGSSGFSRHPSMSRNWT